MSAPVLGMRQYSSSQGRGAENTARNEDFPALAELWIFPAIRYMARPTSWLSNPLRPPPFFLARFLFFQTNNLQINGHNYLWPPQLRTTAIKLINRGRLSVSPDCCVIRGAINKAVLLPCDILQMVWQLQRQLKKAQLQLRAVCFPFKKPWGNLNCDQTTGSDWE